MAAQDVELRIPCVERDGAGGPRSPRRSGRAQMCFRPVPIGREARVGGGPREVAHRRVRTPQREVGAAAAAERGRVLGQELDRLRVVAHRLGMLAEPPPCPGAVVVGGGISRSERDRAVEILDGLARQAERQQQAAAVVVDGGVLGKELDGAVEILERELVLPGTGVGDGPVRQDGRAPVVGQRGVAERVGIGGDRLGGVALDELGGGLLHFGARRHLVRRLGGNGNADGGQHEAQSQRGPSSQAATGQCRATGRLEHRSNRAARSTTRNRRGHALRGTRLCPVAAARAAATRQIFGDEARRTRSVQPDGRARGLECGHALRQEPGDEAGEHVSGPGGGEPGGRLADRGAPSGPAMTVSGPLEDDVVSLGRPRARGRACRRAARRRGARTRPRAVSTRRARLRRDGAGKRLRAPAKEVRASASSTAAGPAPRTAATRLRRRPPIPQPGPMRTTLRRRSRTAERAPAFPRTDSA